MKLFIINGPNINMLGIREPDIYGNKTYEDLLQLIQNKADEMFIEIQFFQSNHEGELVDIIQSAYNNADGIIINPAAYTHTSIALLDAVKAVNLPTIEVHISNPDERDSFRKISYIRSACIKTITGHGFNGYLEAIDIIYDYLFNNKSKT